MNTQYFTPIGLGSLPDPGFTLDSTSTEWWQAVDDPIGNPDDSTTYAVWAANLTAGLIGATLHTQLFEGNPDNIINAIHVFIRASGGLDANYNPITPSGAGNKFYLGIRTGSPRANYYKPVILTTGNLKNYIIELTTKDGVNPFLGSDLVNFEIGLWYGPYAVNAGKVVAPNDNAANIMTQMYAYVDYSPPQPKAGGAALLFL